MTPPALPAANVAAAAALASDPPSSVASPMVPSADVSLNLTPSAAPAAPEETTATLGSIDDLMAEVQRLEDQGKLVEASALLLQAQAGAIRR